MIYYTIVMIVLCAFIAGKRAAEEDALTAALMGLFVLINVTSLIFIS